MIFNPGDQILFYRFQDHTTLIRKEPAKVIQDHGERVSIRFPNGSFTRVLKDNCELIKAVGTSRSSIGSYRARKHEQNKLLSLELASKIKSIGVRKVSDEFGVNYNTLLKYLNQESSVPVDAPWVEACAKRFSVKEKFWGSF